MGEFDTKRSEMKALMLVVAIGITCVARIGWGAKLPTSIVIQKNAKDPLLWDVSKKTNAKPKHSVFKNLQIKTADAKGPKIGSKTGEEDKSDVIGPELMELAKTHPDEALEKLKTYRDWWTRLGA